MQAKQTFGLTPLNILIMKEIVKTCELTHTCCHGCKIMSMLLISHADQELDLLIFMIRCR